MRDRYDQGLFLSADKQIKPPVSKLRSPQSSLLGGRAFPKFAFLRELTGNCVSFHGQNYLAGASVAAMTAYFHRGARCALARRTVTVSAVAVLFLGLTSIGAQYTRSEFVRVRAWCVLRFSGVFWVLAETGFHGRMCLN
jgi:hypothetical protein